MTLLAANLGLHAMQTHLLQKPGHAAVQSSVRMAGGTVLRGLLLPMQQCQKQHQMLPVEQEHICLCTWYTLHQPTPSPCCL